MPYGARHRAIESLGAAGEDAPMNQVSALVSRTVGGYGEVLRNANLRRLQLAWGGAITAEWAHFVALGVFAYETGGALGVGLVGFVRLLPAALLAPFAASLGDRLPRERLLLGAALVGAAALGGSAFAYASGPSEIVIYVLAAVLGVTSTLFRPAQQALIPSLATTPEQLVAANGSSAFLESLGTLLGPLLGGVVVATADAGVVFAVAMTGLLLSAALLARVRVEGRPVVDAGAGSTPRAQALEGFRALARDANARLIVGLMAVQASVRGALNVLIVVVAFRLLEGGEGWVGLLTAALGAGGLVGAIGAITLAGRPLAVPFALGLLFWGVPISLLGGSTEGALALALIAVVGVANSVEDVAGFTLLQRIVPDAVLTRVLGALWGLAMGGVALGSIAASGLVAAVGERGGLVITGTLLPLLTLLTWRRLRAIDRAAAPPPKLDLLKQVPMFAPLPVATKEQIARRLVRVDAPAGTAVIREGDEGDRFYVLDDGQVEIRAAGGTRLCAPGDYFGEIALLRDVARTATVVARTDCTLYALERDDFLSAVTGHAAVHTAGQEVVAERLEADERALAR